MAEKRQDKAIVYSQVYVRALAGAAEEISGMLNEADMLAQEPKGYDKLRNTVTSMLALGEDSTPQQVQESLERLNLVAEETVRDLREAGLEKGSVHMIFAKGLAEFTKTQEAAFLRNTEELLNPEQPINEQELEKKTAGRMKVSLDNLQKEVQGVVKEKHERVQTAEKQQPAKSSAPMGKR